jgi:methylaspartate mutase epsilon subunit
LTYFQVENSFGAYVSRAHQAGILVVQPRMGFSHPDAMRAGLVAVSRASATTVGTITLDSYTRVGLHTAARRALDDGTVLNGYPIVAHEPATNRWVLEGVHGPEFPVQVRHGSPEPQDIIAALAQAGLDATEGGPVSYCLPYGRTPLRDAVKNWKDCCALLGTVGERGAEPHLETFGGCMMGQLCPPSLLVALSLLEGLFFRQHGLRSISLSYAQQTDADQDGQAVLALRHLAEEMLTGVDWHVVLYTYMGMYPRTRPGAMLLLEEAAALAVRTGAARIIVKTVSEAFRIPTVAENVAALEIASLAAQGAHPLASPPPPTTRCWRRHARSSRGCSASATTSGRRSSRRSPWGAWTCRTACILTTSAEAEVTSTSTAGCDGPVSARCPSRPPARRASAANARR